MVLSKTATSIYLQWLKPLAKSADGIKLYKVQYRVPEEVSFKSKTSATNSKTYMIRVNATNKFFEGDPSYPVMEKTSTAGEYTLRFNWNSKFDKGKLSNFTSFW